MIVLDQRKRSRTEMKTTDIKVFPAGIHDRSVDMILDVRESKFRVLLFVRIFFYIRFGMALNNPTYEYGLCWLHYRGEGQDKPAPGTFPTGENYVPDSDTFLHPDKTSWSHPW